MRDNKGMSYVLVSVFFFIIFALTTAIFKMGIWDISDSNAVNDETKAHYLAESGIYFAGSKILKDPAAYPVETTLEVSKDETPPGASQTGPFYDMAQPDDGYRKPHKFIITIAPSGADFIVLSKGEYNGRRAEVQAKITLSGPDIVYTEMHSVEDKNW